MFLGTPDKLRREFHLRGQLARIDRRTDARVVRVRTRIGVQAVEVIVERLEDRQWRGDIRGVNVAEEFPKPTLPVRAIVRRHRADMILKSDAADSRCAIGLLAGFVISQLDDVGPTGRRAITAKTAAAFAASSGGAVANCLVSGEEGNSLGNISRGDCN